MVWSVWGEKASRIGVSGDPASQGRCWKNPPTSSTKGDQEWMVRAQRARGAGEEPEGSDSGTQWRSYLED